MKIRKGFVSNSSSSSFIICYKANNKDNTEEMVKKFISNNIEEFDGEDELIQFDGYTIPRHRKQFYEKYKNKIKNGYKLEIFNIYSEDLTEETIVEIFDKCKSLGIIDSSLKCNIDYDY